jgi:enoyl-CoA hydratase
MGEAASAEGRAVRCERVGAIGRVTLDPAAEPAGAGDWRRFMETYETWVADPNVYGGLIRRLAPDRLALCRDVAAWEARFNRRSAESLAELADFYRLIWTIDRFSKPTVALLDGEVAWSDFCLVRHGTHKVVGESFRLSFDSPAGWFPDSGATWWLARLPDNLGAFLALTGVTIDGADALAIGLATHRLASASFDDIERAYANADPIDQVLDGLPQLTGGGDLERIRGVVSAAFGAGDNATITSKLASAEADLPVALCGRLDSGRSVANSDLISSLIREASGLTLQQTLERDFAIALALSDGGQKPFASLEDGQQGAHRARAMAELALKPPPGVPQALG